MPTATFLTMKTGDSEHGLLDHFASMHEHSVRVRDQSGSHVHAGVQRWWDERGTWKRPPLLLDRGLLLPNGTGLQVVEGRTRVEVLHGRHRDGLSVATEHVAWIATKRTHNPS